MVAKRSRKYIWKIGSLFGFLLVIYLLVHLSLIGKALGQPDVMVPVAGPDDATLARLQENFGKLPLYFIENQGQIEPPVAYYVQGLDKSFYFTQKGLTFVLSAKSRGSSPPKTLIRRVSYPSDSNEYRLWPGESIESWVVKLDFLGANPGVQPVGRDLTKGVISYFRGPREQWKTDLKTYARVVYPQLWPGIDLVYTGTVNRLKYMFLVRPNADPRSIRLAYRGATSVRVNNAGQLTVQTPVGDFQDDVPYAYQELEGQRVQVAAAYSLRIDADNGAAVYGFELGSYDSSRPLVIDPAVLAYSGYIGGSGSDAGDSIAVDGEGNVYVTGYTSSTPTTFPVHVGPDLTRNGWRDVFVAKVNGAGTELDYCGYIGGGDDNRGNSIAVDGAGNAYVTGYTSSTEATFPVTVGPDLTYNGSIDVFVAKVNGAGTALDYCGYIGGSGVDSVSGIAVDGEGNAYIAGYTYSTETTFPVTVGPDLTYNGGARDAFVAKVNAAGTALDYCGYIGGSDYGYLHENNFDYAHDIAVDSDGNAYITGLTTSSQATFPVTVGPDLTQNGYWDAFVAKVKADGTALDYCGFIGGSQYDRGNGIAVDNYGNAYVTGYTLSTQTNFPVTAGPDLTHNGGSDVFVAKVNGAGTALEYCGYIGGSEDDEGTSIAVDGKGNSYVTGKTLSSQTTFPVMVGPDLTHNGAPDAFVVRVKATGAGLDYCGYIGGSADDGGRSIAVDNYGNAYVTGYTLSTEATFPVTLGPDLTYNGGPGDAFVAKVTASTTPSIVPAVDLLLLND